MCAVLDFTGDVGQREWVGPGVRPLHTSRWKSYFQPLDAEEGGDFLSRTGFLISKGKRWERSQHYEDKRVFGERGREHNDVLVLD